MLRCSRRVERQERVDAKEEPLFFCVEALCVHEDAFFAKEDELVSREGGLLDHKEAGFVE